MMYYLFLDLSIIVLPFVFSFNKSVYFFSNWKSALLTASLLAFVFLILALLCTQSGILDLNPAHCLGIFIRGIPLEEIIFFLVVPFTSIFVYENCKYYLRNLELTWFNRILVLSYISYLLVMLFYIAVDWYLLSLIVASTVAVIAMTISDALNKIGTTFLLVVGPAIFAHYLIIRTSERQDMHAASDVLLTILAPVLFSFILVVSAVLVYESIQKRKYQ